MNAEPLTPAELATYAKIRANSPNHAAHVFDMASKEQQAQMLEAALEQVMSKSPGVAWEESPGESVTPAELAKLAPGHRAAVFARADLPTQQTMMDALIARVNAKSNRNNHDD